MDLSIVIVTHNSLSPVGKCLSSVEEHPPSCPYETIVVDNASTDGTPEMIKGEFGGCRLVSNDDNRGYSKGVNQGIDLSEGEFVLILNPDIEVREGSLDTLVRFMQEHPDAGIAGSKLIYADGSLQYSCRAFYTIKALFLRRTFLGKLFPGAKALREHLLTDYGHMETRQVDWLIGACMMVRREAIDKVGKMDERFFLYFEDTDWCYRMHNHGWKVYYVPDSIMTHLYERSSARSVLRKPFILHLLSLLRYYEKWNRFFYFFRRHRSVLKSFLFTLSDLIAVNAGFFAAYYLRVVMQPLFTKQIYSLEWYFYYLLFFNILVFLTFLFGGLYRIRRETGAALEFSQVARSLLTAIVILLGATYLTRIRLYSRAVILGQAVFTVLFVFGSRYLIRRLHRVLVRASFDLKRVVLAGSVEEAADFREALVADPDMGIDIVGYIGDGADSLGSVDDLTGIVDRFKVQEVIILPSCAEKGLIMPFIMNSGPAQIQIRIVSPVARFLGRETRVERVGGSYMFSIERGAQYLFLRWLSRLLDISAAVILLPVSLLLSASCRVYGRITGNLVFYSETRYGRAPELIDWPAATRSSGSQAPDLCRPGLLILLLRGRVSLVGPPPLPVSDRRGETVSRSGFRPGLSGRWRVDPAGGPLEAAEDEVLEMRVRALADYIEIIFKSIGKSLSGEYPEWFFDKEEDQ